MKIKAFITGMIRSGDTYTANGAAEMIKEIMAYTKNEVWKSLFGWTVDI